MTDTPMQMLMPQVKDLSEQKVGKYVVVTLSAVGQLLPMYADDFKLDDGFFTAVREYTMDDGSVGYYEIYGAPQADVKVFATEILNLKTWEQMEREGSAEMKARARLQGELQPETVPVFVPGIGIMPKNQAEHLRPALDAMLKDREQGGPPSGGYR